MKWDAVVSAQTLINDFGAVEKIVEKHGYAVIISDNMPKYTISEFDIHVQDDCSATDEADSSYSEQSLVRLLNGIGMRVFVTYYDSFMNDENPFEFLQSERFTENSIRSRFSKARTIFRQGLEKDALIMIAKSSRADYETRRRAKELIHIYFKEEK